MNNQHTESDESKKLEWVEPKLRRLEAGAAESETGPLADGGGGFQGS